MSLVEGRACDTLLSISKTKVALKDSIIKQMDVEICNLNKISIFKEDIIAQKELKIQDLNKRLDTEIKKHKWTKYGWAATASILGTLVLILSVR